MRADSLRGQFTKKIMTIFSTILICFSLSLDNGAAALAAGCACRLQGKTVFTASSIFLLAHVIMLSIGWFGGHEIGRIVEGYDHWISFLVLAYLGAKMAWEALSNEDKSSELDLSDLKKLAVISFATSFDALAVGVSLNLAGANYSVSLLSMSLFVFAVSLTGFKLGARLGVKFGKSMAAFGGLVLIAIGVKILLEGLR